MTYCVALRLDTGMIFASDSRTNAGVDHIATFSKMRVYEKNDDRVIVVLSSGNLAMTQGVVNILDRHARFPTAVSVGSGCSRLPPAYRCRKAARPVGRG